MVNDPERGREIPQATPTWHKSDTPPLTPMESLMSAAPFEDPEVSLVELLGVRDKIVDLFDTLLNEEEKWVLNATVSERMSLRAVASQIGTSKTTVARVRDGALKKLRDHLQESESTMATLRDLGLTD